MNCAVSIMMSALPVAAAQQADVESCSPESVESARCASNAEPAAQTETADLREHVLGLKRKLEEAASECGRLQISLATQQQLEELLRHGRTHLQDLRSRLQQVTAERDRLETEIQEATKEALLQRTVAEERLRETLAKDEEQQRHVDRLREQLQEAKAAQDRLARHLDEREAAHKQFADERADERFTFEKLLAEATANQRDMVQELDEQRQQVQMLREAAMRAQSLARQIMRAHETDPPEN